jgi:predicted dehydrogenase
VDAAWALNTSEEREASVTLFGTRAGADMKNGLILTGGWEAALPSTRPDLPPDAGPGPSSDATHPTPAYLQARAFVDAILEDRDPPVSPRQALVVAQIVESLYESDRAQRPICLAADTG